MCARDIVYKSSDYAKFTKCATERPRKLLYLPAFVVVVVVVIQYTPTVRPIQKYMLNSWPAKQVLREIYVLARACMCVNIMSVFVYVHSCVLTFCIITICKKNNETNMPHISTPHTTKCGTYRIVNRSFCISIPVTKLFRCRMVNTYSKRVEKNLQSIGPLTCFYFKFSLSLLLFYSPSPSLF